MQGMDKLLALLKRSKAVDYDEAILDSHATLWLAMIRIPRPAPMSLIIKNCDARPSPGIS